MMDSTAYGITPSRARAAALALHGILISNLIGKEDLWTRDSNPHGTTHPVMSAEAILDLQRRGVRFQSHTCNQAGLPASDSE